MGYLDLENITGGFEGVKEGEDTEKAGDLKDRKGDTKSLEARDFKEMNAWRDAAKGKPRNTKDGKSAVKQVLEPGLEEDTPAYDAWLEIIDQKNIQRTIAKAGQQIDLGEGIRLEVLHPQEEFLEGTDSDIDNNSVVLRLVWKKVSFLLTGDIHQEAEQEILYQGYKLNSTILKVAHHGSSSSTSEQFLTAVDPEVAVICVGNNTFGHPHDEIVERLLEKVGGDKVYLTSKEVNNGSIILPKRGTITFTTDGERLWVKTEE